MHGDIKSLIKMDFSRALDSAEKNDSNYVISEESVRLMCYLLYKRGWVKEIVIFNCETNQDALKNFLLGHIHQNKSNHLQALISFGVRRIDEKYQNESQHYFAVDFIFHPEEKPLIIIQDSINDKNTIVHDALSELKLLEQCEIYQIIGTPQKDASNCAFFSLEHLIQTAALTNVREFVIRHRSNDNKLPQVELPPNFNINYQSIKYLDEYKSGDIEGSCDWFTVNSRNILEAEISENNNFDNITNQGRKFIANVERNLSIAGFVLQMSVLVNQEILQIGIDQLIDICYEHDASLKELIHAARVISDAHPVISFMFYGSHIFKDLSRRYEEKEGWLHCLFSSGLQVIADESINIEDLLVNKLYELFEDNEDDFIKVINKSKNIKELNENLTRSYPESSTTNMGETPYAAASTSTFFPSKKNFKSSFKEVGYVLDTDSRMKAYLKQKQEKRNQEQLMEKVYLEMNLNTWRSK